jgi:predicted RNA-binding protein with TRAM domain
MNVPDQLRCLFTTDIETKDDTAVIEIPRREIEHGNLRAGETYRVAILPEAESTSEAGQSASTATKANRGHDGSDPNQSPPIEEGDQRRVEIEAIGDQGDGIARLERGFVVIVPDTEKGERVVIEITDTAETVAFADVVERVSYYD